MKLAAALLCFATLFTSTAFARVNWVGNIKLKTNRRGSNYESNVGSVLKLNVCDYGVSVIELEAYKAGVTDSNGSIWQEIDADARTYQNSTGNIIGTARPNVVGRRGNNAVYQIALLPLSPSAVTGLDPASQDATLEVAFDGKTMVSIPVEFSCNN